MLRKDIKKYWKENGFLATLDYIKTLEETKRTIKNVKDVDNKKVYFFGFTTK